MKKIIAFMLLIGLVSFCQPASAEIIAFDTTDYYTGYIAATETFNVGSHGSNYSFDGSFHVDYYGLSIEIINMKPPVEVPTVQPNFLEPVIDWSFFENRRDFIFSLPVNSAK